MGYRKKYVDVEIKPLMLIGNLEAAIETLRHLKKEHADYKYLYIAMRYDYYDEAELVLRGKRLETDTEFKKRTAQIKGQKKKAQARERELYEKLKKKYENE